ncbi:GNAT family N-acetyltransferase [Pontixanthobacter aestiaquae]|uniref:GNAT family N-acetyltransferase n=1 Tax=Pontixanthobacter aestiaquae TaxID=1509367 RepID=A0A844Z5J9_9SPHN|nr:GNAT family N-acetyltransferase [Pontixanthobacter aestiaquae]MDN3646918.1 GNAT family N-acetyltransferase [Pontixanthobacter aestiaquae]MXO82100.1 GNAT family N-acetyltransferase [Pontixanthobacter aestiaquae]
MGDLVLETAQLVLRRVDEGDAELQHRILNTAAVMKHLGGVKELHEIETKHAKTMASFAREGFGFMMMIEKATGDMVGHAGLKRVDHTLALNQGDMEIGWLVREDRWRRGYAMEAARAVRDLAFVGHDTPLLVALTSAANVGSWRIMEKLGMRRRKDLDFNDPNFPAGENPTIQYSIDREEWQASR